MTCKTIEQDLALAAADCLDTARLLEIREHCRDCPECATRLEQFQHVAATHSRAAKELDGLALRYDRAASPGRNPLVPVWRWLLPIGAVAAMTAAVVLRHQPAGPSQPQVKPPRVTAALAVPVAQSPSLAAYRSAMEKSGVGSLDALLARDADRLLRQTPDQGMRDLRGEAF